MHEHVNEMLKLYAKVTTAGFNIDDKTAGSLLLAGLSAEYRPMILGIDNSGTAITVDYVKNLLLQNVMFETSDEQALAVKKKGKFGNKKNSSKKKVKCYNCSGDHYRNKCPQLKQNNKNETEKVLFCLRSECNTEKQYNCSQVKQIDKLSEVFFGAGALWTNDEDTWYIDSGASSHMTNNESSVIDVVKCDKDSVFAADGKKMDIIGKGDIRKKLADESELIIKNVEIIPSICANLLSVSQIVMKSENKVTFDKYGCKITNGNGNLIASGRLENGMFKLNLSANRAYTTTKKGADIRLWHKRFGHIGFDSMRFLNLKIPNGLKCKICIKGKQSRKPFNVTGDRARKKLEVIHTDVCGPLPVQSIGGNRYFVTFIDDFTRKVFIYAMKNKNRVLEHFKDFKIYVENQTECRIKILRSDNGGEYVNELFYQFCQDHGIEHQKSAPYSPQQNGLAERMNRTLLDRVRCMLLDSGLSRGFWAEAIQYASIIINNVPCKGTEKSPEESWRGKTPDFSAFKVFGCTAIAHVPDQKRKKLDDKGIECIFIGMASDAKAYRLYCKPNKKIIISRDVDFLENDYNSDNFSSIDTNNDHFFIETENICEPGGVDSDGEISSQVLDENSTQNSANGSEPRNSNSVSQISENGTATQSNDTSIIDISDESLVSANESGENLSTDVSRYEMDDADGSQYEMDDPENDPTFTTRARLDENLNDPETRSKRQINGLMDFGFALCTGTPVTHEEALKSEECKNWLDAMKIELEALMRNDTWELVDLPKDRKAIKNRWVFARKTDNTGETIRYKARLVAKGFSQRPGIDFTLTFSPVARYSSLRFILAIAADMDLEITQMDAVSAFLNGPLREEVFMEQPPHFNDGSNKVCRLKRSIYGLKQSSRNWNKILNNVLAEFGLKRTISDQCVYVSKTPTSFMMVLVWVDDVLIAFNDAGEEERLRAMLSSRFQMKYLGNVEVILGVNITSNREKRTISIDQAKYINQLLERFKMTECNPISTPMDVNTKYSKTMDSGDKIGIFPYREAIGSLLFAAQVTRPDINFSVILLSRYLDKPKTAHWVAAKRIMRYLKGTLEMKLTFGSKNGQFIGYCDSDYAADVDDRKSTSGYVFLYGGGAISWQTKKQAVVAQSTAEAEYTALALAAKEALWLRSLRLEMLGKGGAMQMFCDNKGAVDMAHNNNSSDKTKHIDVKLKFIHNEIENDKIKLDHIGTNEMLADVLTKSLTREKHNNCINCFGFK